MVHQDSGAGGSFRLTWPCQPRLSKLVLSSFSFFLPVDRAGAGPLSSAVRVCLRSPCAIVSRSACLVLGA